MAEREGFEPPVGLRLHVLSKHAHSTTLPPLRCAPGWCVSTTYPTGEGAKQRFKPFPGSTENLGNPRRRLPPILLFVGLPQAAGVAAADLFPPNWHKCAELLPDRRGFKLSPSPVIALRFSKFRSPGIGFAVSTNLSPKTLLPGFPRMVRSDGLRALQTTQSW